MFSLSFLSQNRNIPVQMRQKNVSSHVKSNPGTENTDTSPLLTRGTSGDRDTDVNNNGDPA